MWFLSRTITWYIPGAKERTFIVAPCATGDTNWSQILPIYEVRGDEALLYGASASAETAAERGFRAAAGASYVRGFYRNGNGLGKRWGDMPQIPPFKFHGELGYIWQHCRPSAYTDFALARYSLVFRADTSAYSQRRNFDKARNYFLNRFTSTCLPSLTTTW